MRDGEEGEGEKKDGIGVMSGIDGMILVKLGQEGKMRGFKGRE